MKLFRAAMLATVVLAAAPAFAQTEQKSQLANGLVVLQPDPALSDGRLVLRVVGLNQTTAAVQLRAQDVTITTASGAPVSITSLAQLIRETQGAAGVSGAVSVAGPAAGGYSGPTGIMTNSITGQAGITNFTGGSTVPMGPVDGKVAAKSGKALTPEAQKALDDQIAGLRAAILDSVEIKPKDAQGGQIVTEKLKFKGADKRGLKVTVSFAGELHQFAFTAPPAK